MDAVSYSHSAKQAQRIEKFIENPDSNSGIVTVPKVIGAGESVTIPTWYRDWETDRKSTRLNSSHSAKSRMPSSA